MNESAVKDYLVVSITLLLGMVLTVIPMPQWAVWLRPNWVLAILIFWMMTASHRMGIGLAWLVGLFMDLLTGTLLGQQALIFSLIGYLVLKFQHRLAHMSVLQQTATIFLLMLLDLIIDRCLMIVFQHSTIDWLFWLSAMTTAVIWPWLSGLLYLCQIKCRVADVS